METLTSISEAIDELNRFNLDKQATLPPHVQEELSRLAGLGVSPVDRIVRTAELLYANKEKLTRNADRILVARMAEFGTLNGWHGLNDESRGDRIKAVMLAEGKDPQAQPLAEDKKPMPREEFLAPKVADAGVPSDGSNPV